LDTGVDEDQVVTSMCGVCPAGCGVEVHLRAGKIERIAPLRDHPQGLVCPRGMRAAEVVYSADRLLYPERRTGPRGAGQFERVGWDEAYDGIVSRLRAIAARDGPEAVCVYTGRGNFEYGLNEAFAPAGTVESSANAVLFPFGSPNTTGVGALCYVAHGMIAPRACLGDYGRNLLDDLERAELIVVWGANPATASPPLNLRRIKRAQRRGADVVVIDHRRSETAQATGAEWIGVRPGSDGALALGMIHVLIAEALYDREFVENWTHGFGALAEYAAGFAPDTAAAITGVPSESIRRLARRIAAARGCSILTYTGLEYANSGVQTVRAVLCLQALAGHLDAPGGKLFRMRSRLQLRRRLTPPPDGRRPIGADKYPLYYAVRTEAHAAELPEAILCGRPYPIRALIVGGASLLTAWPDPGLWRRALRALDLLVTIDRFPTADSVYADYRLPATTLFEIESYGQAGNHVQLRQRVIEPLGEARSDYLIYAELARRLGYGHLWPQTEAEAIRAALEGSPVTLEMLRAQPAGVRVPEPEQHYRKYRSGERRTDGRPGFETPTGKFELASEWLRQHGYPPLPEYTEPTEGPLATPELARRYPLVFNSGARTQADFRSQHHNIPGLLRLQPVPLVHLNEADAAARDIRDGDAVEVVSPRGRVRLRARVTDDIVAGVVEANMGGGGIIGALAWQQANINELTDPDNRDPLSGFPVFKALLCDVVRCEDAPAAG
jgi:anaerobic selenocysteine-containing dehydrogenase